MLGLSPADIDDITPLTIMLSLKSKQDYDSTMFREPVYQAGRLAGFLAMLPHTKRGTLKNPADIYPFSFEKQANPPKPPTAEEVAELLKKLDN